MIALALALVSCRSTSDPATGVLSVDLNHADPKVRIAAAQRAVAESRDDLLPLLVANLADRDGAVRFFTQIALRKLTSEDFGYSSSALPEDRARAIARWRRWLDRRAELAERAAERSENIAPAPAADPGDDGESSNAMQRSDLRSTSTAN